MFDSRLIALLLAAVFPVHAIAACETNSPIPTVASAQPAFQQAGDVAAGMPIGMSGIIAIPEGSIPGRARYHYASRTWEVLSLPGIGGGEGGNPPLRGPAPHLLWSAIEPSGSSFYYWYTHVGSTLGANEIMDGGVLCGSPASVTHSIRQLTFGYRTQTLAVPQVGDPDLGVSISLYWNFDPTCPPGLTGGIADGGDCPAANHVQFDVLGMPGSVDGVQGAMWIVDIDLTGVEPSIPAGHFGWSFHNWVGFQTGTGPLVVANNQISAPGTGNGVTSYTTAPQAPPFRGTYWFGGNPYAQFYFEVYAAEMPPSRSPPQPPIIVSPGFASGPGPVINTMSPNMNWQAPARAEFYGLYISVGPNFTTLVYEVEGFAHREALTIPAGVLQPNTQYRWNMRAGNGGGCGGGWSDGYSDRLYFQTGGPAPANDDCANAVGVTTGSTPFSTVFASVAMWPPPPTCAQATGATIGSDIWFNYTASATGTLSVDTCGSGFDTVLVVYGGAACPLPPWSVPNDSQQLACNDDACDRQAALTVPVTAGASYKIRVGGYNGAVGNGTLRLIFAPGSPCANGLLRDCNGNCAPISWLGDGYCDNGFYAYYGVPIYFNCQQFGNDGGDCDSPMPPIMNPPNHNVPATPPQYDLPCPPTGVQDKLILVTHGWNTTDAQITDFWEPLVARIQGEVSEDWQVCLFNWASASRTPSWQGPAGAQTALARAVVRGNGLGVQIGEAIASGHVYSHVHLIAHSAGSGLIAQAAAGIRQQDVARYASVHTTYLDAFGGITHYPGPGGYASAYGGNADWSDHYYSRDVLECGGTGVDTQLHLPLCHNVDVSQTDPLYEQMCLSTHSWPRCFFAFTVHPFGVGGCAPPSGTYGYGLPLSLEKWADGGGASAWLQQRQDYQAPQPRREDHEVLGGGVAAASMFLDIQTSPSFDVESITSFASDVAAVQTTGGMLTMTTLPPGAADSVPAWINFQITTSTLVNFIAFDLAFTGDAGAAGLLTMYVNGHECGVVDEPYALPGSQFFRLPTPGDLAPGQHYLSFRLDHFNQLASSVTIQNIATGFGEFVPACRADFDENGQVQVPDIFAFLSAWFAQDPRADFDGVPGIAVPDIFAFLSAWFAGCA